MELFGQLFSIISFFICAFVYLRMFIYGIKCYQLNKNALKKRHKGETFIEWLVYSRFKNEIPKIILILYFSVLIVHFTSIIACVIMHFTIASSSVIGKIIVIVILYLDCIWVIILRLMFWTNDRHKKPYERWITKRRGQPPKKKKR